MPAGRPIGGAAVIGVALPMADGIAAISVTPFCITCIGGAAPGEGGTAAPVTGVVRPGRDLPKPFAGREIAADTGTAQAASTRS